ncbi:very short patch repair endonuclease [Paenibacillus sp. Cedars]|uniref:very short patch repair endonuclease n=1 Tax=Paenibacillus sp. Cedars TaxID=1980674 RepID=UPI001164C543|nr:very short patch repair endonuclease [Paenibacillus sp. Cedars]AWP26363.1 very short patch repair endonuclease [Paenibacillus sp. Cedars]
MADKISKEARSKIMSAIRSKGTKLEDRVSKELWRRGYRFRKNLNTLFGKPDIAIKKYKVVIFLDSCFWHGCDIHYRIPKSNYDYWFNKIERNRARDKVVNEYYEQKGWTLIRVWDHEVKEDIEAVIDRIDRILQSRLVTTQI